MTNEDKKIQKQIQETKYKIIIFILILFSFVYWWNFMESFEQVNDLQDQFDSNKQAKESIQQEIKQAKQNIDLLEEITQNKEEIINCINEEECILSETLELGDKIKDDVIRNYLLIKDHNVEKMDYDQRLILQNVNEFLLNTNTQKPYWNINIISFGNTSESWFYEWLYELPITLSAEFSNIDNFFNFLENIEINTSIDLPVLYKIDSINYDIIRYDEPQTVNINLTAYFK